MFGISKIFGKSQLRQAPILEAHAYLADVPQMDEATYAGLRDSIRTVGLQQPITLMDDAIIDGRARYRACCELGVQPEYARTETAADDVLATWLEAQNLHRRHLTEAQRAMVAARLSIHRGIVPAKVAEQMSVSRATTMRAKAVLVSGDSNVISLVERGKLSMNAAYEKVKGRDGGPPKGRHERVLHDLEALLGGKTPWPAELRQRMIAAATGLADRARAGIAA